MKNKRIIIENRTKMSDMEAVELALLVMRQGRILIGPMVLSIVGFHVQMMST